MSYKYDCSAKYPNVSKLHFWNSSRGPYTTGAVHVSVTAVAEAQQTYGEDTTAPPPTVLCLCLSTQTYAQMKWPVVQAE